MGARRNHLGQPIGFQVPNWKERPLPPRTMMQGRWCRLEPLDPERHAADLYAANDDDKEGRMWTYLAYGPFATFKAYVAKMKMSWLGDDPLVQAIVDTRSGVAVGLASYLHIDPRAGSIEVGGVTFSPRLQRTTAATEAMYLMMKRAFDDLGYRRYEWKCNALNYASINAAKRLGFQFEGIFRQAAVVKGRNRDNAWFSIIDREWPEVKAMLESWLDPNNFDLNGQQLVALSRLRHPTNVTLED
jgi:RimJ/RimL family protein N-acetyltransferase